jgi:hypothetical protein
MATVRVSHGIGDLVSDLVEKPAQVVREGSGVVKKNVRAGHKLAQKYAQGLSGPHGTAYYKRITAEMLTPLSGEFGPNEGGTPVGGGWRTGAPNTELERAQDVIGPKFAKDIGDMVDGLFW